MWRDPNKNKKTTYSLQILTNTIHNLHIYREMLKEKDLQTTNLKTYFRLRILIVPEQKVNAFRQEIEVKM